MRVVIWDVDDVLNDLMRKWFEEWWRPRHAESTLHYIDLTVNPPHEVLAVSEEEYLRSLDAFRIERYETLVPQAETLAWFSEHGHRCRNVALTAVPATCAHLSAAWVISHFGRWIDTFAFVPTRDGVMSGKGRRLTKQEYLKWFGRGDVLVDDRSQNIESVKTIGMEGILVPQPWNTSSHPTLGTALQELTAIL